MIPVFVRHINEAQRQTVLLGKQEKSLI